MAERRNEQKVVPTFEVAARRVHESHSKAFRNAKHKAQGINSLIEHVFPVFGDRRVDQIESADVLKALSPIWLEIPETARRVRQRMKAVFDWAKASGFRAGDNPVEGIAKVLPKQRDAVEHHAALPYDLRVSTRNHGQTIETQRIALVDFAKNRGFEIVEEYADDGISGSKDSRPALDRLMKAAQAKKFDAAIVARFDRFARSTKHLVLALEQFNHLGIDFLSLSESVDTSTPMGKMIFTVLGAVAELERNLIRERVAMGLDRARKQKKTLGRPRSVFDREKAKELHAEGRSLREIAAKLGVNKGTVRAAISAA